MESDNGNPSLILQIRPSSAPERRETSFRIDNSQDYKTVIVDEPYGPGIFHVGNVKIINVTSSVTP